MYFTDFLFLSGKNYLEKQFIIINIILHKHTIFTDKCMKSKDLVNCDIMALIYYKLILRCYILLYQCIQLQSNTTHFFFLALEIDCLFFIFFNLSFIFICDQ